MTQEVFDNKVKVDYSAKMIYMLPNNVDPKCVDQFLMIMNYSFMEKNNFFVKNFNTKMISTIYKLYNQMKSNILDPNQLDIFNNLNLTHLKLAKFICSNFINNITEKTKQENKILFDHVDIACITTFNNMIIDVLSYKEQ